MADTMILTEDEVLELLALLVTSARTQLQEPAHYGPMRLLVAAERLSQMAKNRTSSDTQRFLAKVTQDIPEINDQALDLDGYTAPLDALCYAVGQHLAEHFSQNGDDA